MTCTRTRRFAWSTGLQFPSRLWDNVSAVRISPDADRTLANHIYRIIRRNGQR